MLLARSRLLALLACAACGTAPAPDAAQAHSARGDSAAPAAAPRAVAPPAAVTTAPVDSAAQEIRGVRTSLREGACKVVSVDEEGGGSTERCTGTAGYGLILLEGDARMSLTIVSPDGREHPLDLWSTVTGGFSNLGEEAEWRVRGEGAAAVPIALMVGLKASEHDDATGEMRAASYRVIAKITPTEACVTHALPGSTPEAEARRLADAAASAPCRTSYGEP
jgi:hypothetical protein